MMIVMKGDKMAKRNTGTGIKHKIGDDIYVDTSLYMSHGSDDFHGGLCRISDIKTDKYGTWIEVSERTGHSYNYEVLLEEQAELKKEFGNRRGYPDPDIDTPWIEPGDHVTTTGPDGTIRSYIADKPEW